MTDAADSKALADIVALLTSIDTQVRKIAAEIGER
jgi:hypothetical protein